MEKTQHSILFGEDDPMISSMYANYFRSKDYKVTVVSTGDKVVPTMCEVRPDVLVLDMIMPLKMGYEVLQEIKDKLNEKCQSIPVILLSNLSQDEVVNKAKELGVVEYCIKSSTSPIELEKKISALIAR